MGILARVFGVFTGRGSALAHYRSGIAYAKVGKFSDAIAEYTRAIDAGSAPSDVKAMALYNRSLAHSSEGSDQQAAEDLDRLLEMEQLPERIRTQALQRQHRRQFCFSADSQLLDKLVQLRRQANLQRCRASPNRVHVQPNGVHFPLHRALEIELHDGVRCDGVR